MIRVVNRLGAEKLLPITMSMPDVPFALSIPTQTLPGGHGAIRTGRETIQQRQITISGVIYHHDKEAIRQELDSLLPFLLEPPLQVYRQHTDSRFLWARLLSAPQQWIGGDAELHLSITLLVLDPFWYGPEVTVQVSGTQTVDVDGSAPVGPLVRTTGSVAGLTLINNTNSNELIVSGPGVIEVDNEDFTCRINGENRLDAVNPEWLILGFRLLPGENQIETNRAIEMVYRPRWY